MSKCYSSSPYPDPAGAPRFIPETLGCNRRIGSAHRRYPVSEGPLCAKWSLGTTLARLCLLLFLSACDNGSGKDDDEANDGDTASNRDGGVPYSYQDAGDHWIDDGTTSQGDASFDVSVSLSPKIGTVAIVEWSVDVDRLDRAVIEFGLDTNYGMRMPVNLYAPNHRTLVLGMKPSREYHLRVVGRYGETRYESADYVVETGPQPNGLPTVEQITHIPDELTGGYTIACTFAMGGGLSGNNGEDFTWVYILDAEGEYVWWYKPKQGGIDCVRARMSFNGQYMYVANGNVPGPNNGSLIRVTMDGTAEASYDLPKRHHDITVLPDGTVVYFEYDEVAAGFNGKGCDRVMTLNPETRETALLYTVGDDFAELAAANGCHSNAINYVPEQRALSFSILNFNTLILFDLSGNLLWTFGGPQSDFTGASWDGQHQHHVTDEGIFVFNNHGNGGSSVYEYELQGNQAKRVFEYSSGLTSLTMGDVKRLENGNLLITYSNNGVIHEVNPSGELVQETTLRNIGLGYTVRRPVLHGPPPG